MRKPRRPTQRHRIHQQELRLVSLKFKVLAASLDNSHGLWVHQYLRPTTKPAALTNDF